MQPEDIFRPSTTPKHSLSRDVLPRRFSAKALLWRATVTALFPRAEINARSSLDVPHGPAISGIELSTLPDGARKSFFAAPIPTRFRRGF